MSVISKETELHDSFRRTGPSRTSLHGAPYSGSFSNVMVAGRSSSFSCVRLGLRVLTSFCGIGVVLLVLTGAAAHGQDEAELPAAAAVVKRLQETYAPHCCFKAEFDQVTVNVSMDLKDRFQGTMHVKRPGMIALDVSTPEKQRIVVTGRSYTVFFPDEGNSVHGEVPPELNVDHFFGFLANIGDLDQNFVIAYAVRPLDPVEGLFLMEMKDRKNPTGGYQIVLGIDIERFIVRRAIISDALGNYNRFDLTEVRFLPDLPDALFQVGGRVQEGKAAPASGPSGDRERP